MARAIELKEKIDAATSWALTSQRRESRSFPDVEPKKPNTLSPRETKQGVGVNSVFVISRFVLRALAVLSVLLSFGIAPNALAQFDKSEPILNCAHPAIGISPTFGSGGTQVTISSACSLSGATAVAFGGSSATFSLQSNGTIVAYAPGGTAGSAVPVTVSFGNSILGGGDVTFSYPIAEIDLSGPYPITTAVVTGGSVDPYGEAASGGLYQITFSKPAAIMYGISS